MIRTHKEGDKT